MLLMNLESRPVVFEDIGRQVLATGHRKRPEEFMEKIRAIRADDIRQVLQLHSNSLKRDRSTPKCLSVMPSHSLVSSLRDLMREHAPYLR